MKINNYLPAFSLDLLIDQNLCFQTYDVLLKVGFSMKNK